MVKHEIHALFLANIGSRKESAKGGSVKQPPREYLNAYNMYK